MRTYLIKCMKGILGIAVASVCISFAAGAGRAAAGEYTAGAAVSPDVTGNPTAAGSPSPVSSYSPESSADAEKVSITFTRSKAKLKAGQSFKYKVKLTGTDEAVKWSVDKKECAKITKNGKMTALKPGNVIVTAAAGNEIATVNVKIKSQPAHIIAIDAGHQARGDSSTEPVGPGASTKKAKVAGGTSGVVTHVPEYKLTLAVAKKLKSELVSRGYKVVMIRTKNNVNISNKERAVKANKTADICIRLHADGVNNSSISGASALYPSKANKYIPKLSPSSRKLSECVLNAMCDKTKTKNRGLSARDDLTGTNWSKIPVTLIEMGFMTNPAEDRRMKDEDFQKKLAAGMADGIDNYYRD